ncbi:MAG: hypothetical protein BWK79_00300 [Beggiatoa sp. IS2]|nr:MAG: hypothetical protein BWK79_00300 [Beggiatoa sp. IS2]
MLFASDHSESLLYSYFHEFHSEIVRIKHQVKSGEWAMPALSSIASIATLPFRQALINLLERQSIDAAQRGGEYGARLYREAQYLMVGWADEFFLHVLEWEGREAWRNQLLEAKLFNSQAAGQRIFENLETLLSQRDPVTLELARLYLIVLALGFQGKYRASDDNEQLLGYRQKIFFFITQRDPSGLREHLHQDPDKRLFPEAYRSTLASDKERQKWLPALYKWYILVMIMGIGLMLSSVWLWQSVSTELDKVTTQILKSF